MRLLIFVIWGHDQNQNLVATSDPGAYGRGQLNKFQGYYKFTSEVLLLTAEIITSVHGSYLPSCQIRQYLCESKMYSLQNKSVDCNGNEQYMHTLLVYSGAYNFMGMILSGTRDIAHSPFQDSPRHSRTGFHPTHLLDPGPKCPFKIYKSKVEFFLHIFASTA